MEIRNVSEKIIKGFSIRTDNETEMNPDKGRIPTLWKMFDENIEVNYQGGERVFGVYFNYESDHNGKFDVLAGFDGRAVPPEKKIEQIAIPRGKYIVFTHRGDMPQIAIDAWTEVWQYFSNSNPEHERLYTTDFEYYPSEHQIEVHIAVK
ncbi:effector binding domain-containing protein [Endozoicomonas sp. G2_1]|nr:effector binding domain-containing protein [Endozoicomonas sp. G2_1]MBO9491995.1 effector binding domain-containing protein [Endozoicomonas sp. G2_1]